MATQGAVLLKISVVSPHRDDACFSLGLSILRWAKAGHRIRIVNCFTRSAYAPYTVADTLHPNDRTSYVSALREREDKSFLRQVPGADMVDLRLKDAPLRLRCKDDAVCHRMWDGADPAIIKIEAALEKRFGPDQVDFIFLPLGLGRHIDHSTVREAATRFARELPCGFYEDMPYGTGAGAELEAQELREQIGAAMLSELPDSSLRVFGETEFAGVKKRELALIYDSQISDEEADAMARAAELHGGERVWVNERFARLEAAAVANGTEALGAQPML